VHHNYEDSDSGYEMDAENKGKSFGVGGYRGRIIFLGDGTEVLTDSDDTEMFDNTDEDKASTDGSSAPQPASEASATETKPETEAAKPSESETAPSKQEKSESEDKKD